jgi:hypothetical protein
MITLLWGAKLTGYSVSDKISLLKFINARVKNTQFTFKHRHDSLNSLVQMLI